MIGGGAKKIGNNNNVSGVRDGDTVKAPHSKIVPHEADYSQYKRTSPELADEYAEDMMV